MALQLKDGAFVPGATTILKLLDKPFLVKWANKLGKEGKDCDEVRDQAAQMGTLIHEIIQSHLTKTEITIDEKYTDDDIANAEKAFARYMEWEANHTIENVEIEKELVSETYRYGGYLDVYCKVDGYWSIIDIKTSKKIGTEQAIQVSAYEQLVRENNLPVDRLYIVNVGKLDNSKLEVMEIARDKSSKYFKLFKQLVDVYYTKKEIGWDD